MKVVFLDDDPERQREFQENCPEVQNIESTAAGIINLLNAGIEIDTLFLDHDLGGEVYVDPNRKDCGMEVVRFLKRHRRDIKLIVVHTRNHLVDRRMAFDLMEAGYRVYRQQFGSAAFWRLAKISTPEEHLEAVRVADANAVLTAGDREEMLRQVNEELRQKLILLGFCPDCQQEIDHDIDEPFASCGCAGTMEWTGKLPLISELRHEKRQVVKENNVLRGVVAHAPGARCVYCGIDDMSKCSSGFPGCAKADDMLCAGDPIMESMKQRMRAVEDSSMMNRIVIRILHSKLDHTDPKMAKLIQMVGLAHTMQDNLLLQQLVKEETQTEPAPEPGTEPGPALV